MSTVTTKDGVAIFYKDWGPKNAQPIVFHHGWPLSADDWDTQMLYFLGKGYRVVAHDRRGHGRSSQVSDGPRHGPLRRGRAPPSSRISICATPSTLAIRPAAARRRTMSRSTARAVSPNWYLSAQCRQSC